MRHGGWAAARVMLVMGVVVVAAAREAKADPAQVSVGQDDERFATPPRPSQPVAVYDEPPPVIIAVPPELYGSPVRLHVGPEGITTGPNLGLGLGVAADFGTGTVGARLAAAWLRGDANSGAPGASSSPLGTSLAQYTGELTIDLHKRGPIHPVFGLGFGVVHIDRPGGGGSAGIGTARFGVEYALGLEDADVRIGGGVLGAMPGPADREVADLRGYAMFGGSVAIGF